MYPVYRNCGLNDGNTMQQNILCYSVGHIIFFFFIQIMAHASPINTNKETNMNYVKVQVSQNIYKALQEIGYVWRPPCYIFLIFYNLFIHHEPSTLGLTNPAPNTAFRWCRLIVLVYCFSPRKYVVCPKKLKKEEKCFLLSGVKSSSPS